MSFGSGKVPDLAIADTLALTNCRCGILGAAGAEAMAAVRAVCAATAKSEAECGPSRHAAAPKRRQELAVMIRTDERRKLPPDRNSPPCDASFGLWLLLVTAGQTRLAVFLGNGSSDADG